MAANVGEVLVTVVPRAVGFQAAINRQIQAAAAGATAASAGALGRGAGARSARASGLSFAQAWNSGLERGMQANRRAAKRGNLFSKGAFSDDAMKRFSNTARNAGRAMTWTTSGATAAGLGFAAYQAGKFQSQMNELKIVSEATAGQMERFDTRIKQLGESTTFTSTEVAEGAVQLSKAGLSAGQVYDALPGAIGLAAASGEDLAKVSELVATNLNSFGFSGKQATGIADQLAKVEASTAAETASLGEALRATGSVLGGVYGTGSGIGVAQATENWNQLSATLGYFADNGLKGSTAGTTLKQMFLKLQNPSAESAAIIDKLNLNLRDQEGNFKSLIPLSRELYRETANMGRAEREAAFAQLGGARAVNALQLLWKSGRNEAKGYGESISSLNTELNNSNMTAEELARAKFGDLAYSFEKLKGAAQNFAIALGDAMTPSLVNLMDNIAEAFRRLAEVDPGKLEALGKAMGVIAIAGPATWLAGGFAQAINNITAFSTTAAGALGTLAGRMKAVTALNTAASGAGILPTFLWGKKYAGPSRSTKIKESLSSLKGGLRGLSAPGAAANNLFATAAALDALSSSKWWQGNTKGRTKYMNGMADAIGNLGKSAQPTRGNTLSNFALALSALTPKRLVGGAGKKAYSWLVDGLLNPFSSKGRGISRSVSALASGLGKVVKVGGATAGILALVGGSVSKFTEGYRVGQENRRAEQVEEVGEAAVKAQEKLDKQGGFKSDFLQSLDPGPVQIFKDALGSLGGIFGKLVDLAMNMTPFGAVISTIGEALGGLDFATIGNGIENFASNFTRFANGIQVAIANIGAEWSGMLAGIFENAPGDFLSDEAESLRQTEAEFRAEAARLEGESLAIERRIEWKMIVEGLAPDEQLNVDKLFTQLQGNKPITVPLRVIPDVVLDKPMEGGGTFEDMYREAQRAANQAGAQSSREFGKGWKQGGAKLEVKPDTGQSRKAAEKAFRSGKPAEIPVVAKIGKAKDTLKNFSKDAENQRIRIRANVAGEGQVKDLKQSINKLKNERVRVTANVRGEGEVKDLFRAINKLEPKRVKISQNGAEEATGAVNDFAAAINAVPSSKAVTISVNLGPIPNVGAAIGAAAGAPFLSQREGSEVSALAGPEVGAAGALSRATKDAKGGKKGATGLDEIVKDLNAFQRTIKRFGTSGIEGGLASFNKRWREFIKTVKGDKKKDELTKEWDKEFGDFKKAADKWKQILKDTFDGLKQNLAAGQTDLRFSGRADSGALEFLTRDLLDTVALSKVDGKRKRILRRIIKNRRDEYKEFYREKKRYEGARELKDTFQTGLEGSVDVTRYRSASSLRTSMNRMTGRITAMGNNINSLISKGVAPGFIRWILNSVGGDPMAASYLIESLAKLPQTDLDQYNADWKAYDTAIDTTSGAAGVAAYRKLGKAGAKEAAKGWTEGFVEGEKELNKQINKTATNIEKRLAKVFRFEVKIKVDERPDNKNNKVKDKARNKANRNNVPNNKNDKDGKNKAQAAVVINNHVYGTPNQSDRDLARSVSREMSWKMKRRQVRV